MEQVFHTILLLALPASGKSEVRNFMAQMDGERLQEEFHIGENLQLDDFPYVHFMRRIDEELSAIGESRIFYKSNEEPFFRNEDWGTLVELLNEDYDDLLICRRASDTAMAQLMCDRIDAASVRAGNPARLKALSDDVRERILPRLEDDARQIQQEKESQFTDDFAGKTIVIEAARGGPDGSQMPLQGAYGYQYSLPQFSERILQHAVILYIQVTPEESRRKNAERAHPEDPGSNLFHGVPEAVMLGDYGCDDMAYLQEHSEKAHTITVKKPDATYHLPIGVFDNRVDLTSFLRRPKDEWTAEETRKVTEAIHGATDTMWAGYDA